VKDWKITLLPSGASLRDVIISLNTSSLQIALLVNEAQKLVGILSDGDIRRAILQGASLDISALSIANTKPTTASSNATKQELLGLMRRKTLHQIPLLDEHGIVTNLITLDELTGIFLRPNWVVLMAGGEGTRLRPLTEHCPKPLLRIGEKPILEKIIENFAEQGFRKFFISINYLAESIKKYFGDGKSLGVTIIYLHEKSKLGTAGSLSLLPEQPKDPLFVMNADLLTDLEFSKPLDVHMANDAYATMVIREFEYQIPYGIVESKNNQLISLQEKPIKQYHMSTGIYILSPQSLTMIPQNIYFDMTTLFQNATAKGHNVMTYLTKSYWLDIGRVDEFEKAQKDWLRGPLI
jgi:dTDP-glucose pyrophosphorylase